MDRALLLLAAMAFVVQVGVAVMLPLLPLFARSLGATPFVLGLLTSAFAVTNAIGQLGVGVLSERLAVRRLLAGGIGGYAAANVLIATAGSAASLVLFRALAGFGGGMMLVGERLYLAQVADPARLAFANGVLSAAGSAGSVAGPAIGGLVAAVADLRAPFLLVGVTSLLATVAAWFLPQRIARPPDLPAAGAGRLPGEDASTTVPKARSSVRWRLGILLASQLGFLSGFGAFITTYAPYAEERLGWAPVEIGVVFGLFGLGSIVLGPWLGRLADARGRRRVGILATVPILAFCLAYLLELPRVVLYSVSIAAGAGVTAMQAAWYALLADATGGGHRGGLFGLVTALSNLGIVVGATVAAQAWERAGDVGLGLVVAGGSVVLAGLALAAHPDDRAAGPAGTQPGLALAAHPDGRAGGPAGAQPGSSGGPGSGPTATGSPLRAQSLNEPG